MRNERGAATVEWTALVLVVALSMGAVVSAGARVDGRSFGAFLAHSILCAARGGCDDGDGDLAAAYGARDAELVRRFAPNLVYEGGTHTLPVDWRQCRSHVCSDAPDDPDLDAHRSARGGFPVTAFTRLVRDGDETFIQYWLYYPDSTTTVANAAGAWRTAVKPLGWVGIDPPEYPGFHRDDWESYQVRIGPAGRALVRASSHEGYQGCKQRRCHNRWAPWTGWSRVSWGSQAGHIRDYRGRAVGERTSSGPGLRLVPLESIDHREYRPLEGGVGPPWDRTVYSQPRSNATG